LQVWDAVDQVLIDSRRVNPEPSQIRGIGGNPAATQDVAAFDVPFRTGTRDFTAIAAGTHREIDHACETALVSYRTGCLSAASTFCYHAEAVVEAYDRVAPTAPEVLAPSHHAARQVQTIRLWARRPLEKYPYLKTARIAL
jgi:hypothetical protein